MAAFITQTSIANRALQILGYQPISSLQENSRGARAMNRAYQPILYKTLRENFWGFSIRRAQLAASSVTPVFGNFFYYPLPPDYLDLAPQDPAYNFNDNDWNIENDGTGPAIVTRDKAPINVRYVSSGILESAFDVCFAEALSANLAYETCEELTQSGTKLQACEKMYDDAINMARKRNAFEMRPSTAPVDTWITKRL